MVSAPASQAGHTGSIPAIRFFFMSPGPGLNGIDLPVAFDSLMLIINIDNSFELPF